MQDLMALRREFESRLQELDTERSARLDEIPAAAAAQARLHRKVQEAQEAQARVLADVDKSLREAQLKAEIDRDADFNRADQDFRNAKTVLDRQLEDENRKAQERLDAKIREIEEKYKSLMDQTRPKEKAYEQYRRELEAARSAYERDWDRRRDDYQTSRQNGLTKERLSTEAASARADFARQEATRAYEQTVAAAKAIFRDEVAAAAADLQAGFDSRRVQILKEWEERKDRLADRYRRERGR
jgi:hypothetical protein